MHWIYYLLLLAIQLAGLVLNILGLPGLWLMVAATGVYAWMTWDQQYVSVAGLVVLLVLAVLAEVVEFVAGSAGAKKAGGSTLGMVGALVGGIVGAIAGTAVIPIPVVGTIIGACAGSFAGAMGVEWYRRGDIDHSLRVGVGAAKGRLLGIVGKTLFGVIILLVTIVMAFPVGPEVLVAPPPTTVPATQPATRPATLPSMMPWL